MRKLGAGGGGALGLAVAALVAVGMSQNTHRQFEKGLSSRSSVITQEVVGAITLAVLALALWQALRVWRGRPPGPMLTLLSIGLVLALGWVLALAGQRAS
jgi:uncharacterized membrane protein